VKNLVDTRCRNVYLRPAEIHVSGRPDFVSTILGSCVSVTLYSSSARAGAICHSLLPSGVIEDGFCYVDSSVKFIFEKLAAVAGTSEDFEAKLFGGSEIIGNRDSDNRVSVGARNVEAAINALADLGVPIVASDTGGNSGRKIFFYTQTGEVYMRRVARAFTQIEASR